MMWCKYCGSSEKHDRRPCFLASVRDDPDFRARQIAGIHERWADPDSRAERIAIVKGQWKDPEFRAKVTKGMRRHNARLWDDPEFRERHAESVGRPSNASFNALSEYGCKEYEAALSEGFSHADAMEIALDAMEQEI